MIKLSRQQIERLCTHAESTYPEECCGLLLGTMTEDDKQVIEVWPTENSWQDAEEVAEVFREMEGSTKEKASKRNRFSIAPEMILKAQKEGRDRNLSIIGIYHSHPDGQPIPSKYDSAIAWECYSYLILSVSQGQFQDLLSWILNSDRQFQREQIVTYS
ncbi:MAG: M67 family metallopeptidase [Chroococcales cyanobacterium]